MCGSFGLQSGRLKFPNCEPIFPDNELWHVLEIAKLDTAEKKPTDLGQYIP